MGQNIKGMSYSTKISIDPDRVQCVGEDICDSLMKINAEYEQLTEAEEKLYSKMGGDVAVDYESAVANIDQYMKNTKRIVHEIAENAEKYANLIREANKEAEIKAAGGGTRYEQLPLR